MRIPLYNSNSQFANPLAPLRVRLSTISLTILPQRSPSPCPTSLPPSTTKSAASPAGRSSWKPTHQAGHGPLPPRHRRPEATSGSIAQADGESQERSAKSDGGGPTRSCGEGKIGVTGLKTHRKKLGLSAKDYGKLLGVSSLTIYNWEGGKSKPRRSQLPRIVAVRGIGKREAMQRLGMGEPTLSNGDPGAACRRHRRRGVFSQTAEEFVLGMLKGGKKLTTGEINAAWKKSGRAHNADNTLSKMTKARKVKRMKVKGQRGSEYRAG